MRLLKSAAAFVVLAWASLAQAQDVPLVLKGDTAVVQVDKVIVTKEDRTIVKSLPFQVIAPSDLGLYFWTYPPAVKASDKGNVLDVTSASKGDLKIELKVFSGTYDEATKKIKYSTQFSSITVAIGDVPQPTPPAPTPTPPSPDPTPPVPPTPVPVSSFRVIFVYESSKTLTASQISVMDSKIVRDYLLQNTTPEGSYAGFRKYDKDQDSSKDTPKINAIWQATKSKVTSVPCVAVEVNGHVDILPLEVTPAAQVEVFKKYKSGSK